MHQPPPRHSKAASAQLPSSILYRSPDGATVVLDIPRSLEESQVRLGEKHDARCRIYSSAAPATPFATPEPVRGVDPDATASPAAQIDALMTAESLRSTLDALSRDYTGEYCLPRLTAPESFSPSSSSSSSSSQAADSEPYIPPDAHHFHGSIHHMKPSFTQLAPKFRLIIMDPPWPNRSVRRTTARYKTARSLSEVQSLLRAVPVPAHLADDGLVAIWITNKPRIADLLRGVLAGWGLHVAAEWTWLKVAADGQPLCPLDSVWRKPWERLLVAKRVGRTAPDGLAPRTIVAVPDVHSRKPSLRGLFGDLLGPDYIGLEVFARGLTAGWWSWGDEVLKFQQPQYWHTHIAESVA
ncbi:hypothetical protein NHJ13734_000468 [Beauveria thailandica]